MERIIKERSVIEFSNATYLECYEHLVNPPRPKGRSL